MSDETEIIEPVDKDLIENPHKAGEDSYDPKIPTATLQIYDYIKTAHARSKDTHINRASSAGYCPRKRWYKRNAYDSQPLTPRKTVNFLLGDLTEKTVLHFIGKGLVGPGRLYSEVSFGQKIGKFLSQGKEIEVFEQETLKAQVGDYEFTAHVDGWGKRNSDGEWELIEIKSAADFGFASFRQGKIDYLPQAHVNMSTNKAKELGVKSVRFFFLKKNTGHLFDRLYFFDQAVMDKVIMEAILANQEEIPPQVECETEDVFLGQGRGKPKLDTGLTEIKWPCNYCEFITTCRPEVKISFQEGARDKTYFTPKYTVERNNK
jgi:hypothetical protein